MEFRALDKGDDRTRFCCGHPALDAFFRRYAGQNQFRHQIGVTYVLVDDNHIAAYVTVAAHSLQLPKEIRGRIPYAQLPVLLIARLAVDRSHKGGGLGRRLLRECATLAEEQAEKFGCFGLATHAKPDATAFYQRFGFIPLGPPEADGSQLHFLSLQQIRAARGPRR